MGTTISIPGSHNVRLEVFGPHTIIAGGGNDWLQIEQGRGKIVVGGGKDGLALGEGGVVSQTGSHGHDSIYLGAGNDTIYEQGHATVGPYANTQFGKDFGAAFINGGELKINETKGVLTETAVSGKQTLIGGSAPTEYIAGPGSTSVEGGRGNSTFVGGSGHDTFTGGSAMSYYEFLSSAAGGHHVITDFVHDAGKLYLEGHSLSYLESHNDVSVHGGNTFITLDGGKTSIELKGFTGLTSNDVTTHKP